MKIARWMIGALLIAAIAITVSFQLAPSRDHWPVAETQPPAQPGEVTLTFLGTSTPVCIGVALSLELLWMKSFHLGFNLGQDDFRVVNTAFSLE